MLCWVFLLQNHGPGHATGEDFITACCEEFCSYCSLLYVGSGQGLWDLISHDFVLSFGVKKGGF